MWDWDGLMKFWYPDRLGVPYRYVPEDHYDYFNVSPDTVPTEKEGHWSSRNKDSGKILKDPDHETFLEYTVPSEYKIGGEFYTDLKGDLYSFGPGYEMPAIIEPFMKIKKFPLTERK